MKRLQQGYARVLSGAPDALNREVEGGRQLHSLILLDPPGSIVPAALFGVPEEALRVCDLPDSGGVPCFLEEILGNPSVENVMVLLVSPVGAGEVHRREDRARGERVFSLLRMWPVIQYAQVTRGLRIALLHLCAEDRRLEIWEHGIWEPFLQAEAWRS